MPCGGKQKGTHGCWHRGSANEKASGPSLFAVDGADSGLREPPFSACPLSDLALGPTAHQRVHGLLFAVAST